MALLQTVKDSVLNFKNWVQTGFFSVAVGKQGAEEIKSLERTSTVRAIFITSDRGIFGIEEELWATIDHVRDICAIHGLDRAFFGNRKTGLVTYTSLRGQRWVIVTDGNHSVIDHSDFSNGKFTSNVLKLDDIYDLAEVVKKIPAAKQKEWEDNLKNVNLKTLGVCMDLTLADDHEHKKDLGVWSFKAMAGGFHKSLTQFPVKIIILIGLCCWFMGVVMACLGGVLIALLMFLLWLILH
jgi:hypothetical protein